MNKFDDYMEKFEKNIEGEVNKVVNWIKKIFESSGAKGAVLGMSGGIDCCTVARLLQKARIPVLLVKMPYSKSMDYAGDRNDADDFIEKFSFESMDIDITEEVNSIVKKIESKNIKISEIAKANIMPRIRMTNLYAIGQTKGYLVAGTGNLSEKTMGYFTKWGDGGCDFNPLAEFTKTEVRIIAKHLGIQDKIINKAPSANLWENQTDEDEMGITYYDLDRYILVGEAESSIVRKVEEAKLKATHKNSPIPVYKR